MEHAENTKLNLPDDLKDCVAFHGHFCPGLVYGYLVAKEAITRLELKRSRDEEVVAICENDSCAVDALQVLLGTTAGKGNFIIKNYGKNAYTILNRSSKKAYRFSRNKHYQYKGEHKKEFDRLDKSMSAGTATKAEEWRLKILKSEDLLSKPFVARSESCAKCGEMTMSTKMVAVDDDQRVCIPCSEDTELQDL
jgi:formylmethanofuran dehydrogenase subunit E